LSGVIPACGEPEEDAQEEDVKVRHRSGESTGCRSTGQCGR
jgi:hypothetical protein